VDLAEQLLEDVLDIGLLQVLLAKESEQHGPVDGGEFTPTVGILLANPDDDRSAGVRI
jgi:hypothetical protein